MPPRIARYSIDASYDQPHFFIQSKGYNAGRPSASPNNYSFVVLVSDDLEKGMLFWVCFALWKSNRFLPHIDPKRGYELNAIAANELMAKTCKTLLNQPGDFLSSAKELKQLIHTEHLLDAQLKIIKQLKKAISRRMIS